MPVPPSKGDSAPCQLCQLTFSPFFFSSLFYKSEDSSPASFEKTLSALSAKITDTQARLDGLRARSRRVRVLWTLYLSFAYLVYSIVIILVVGSQKMGPYEWTGIAGGPVV